MTKFVKCINNEFVQNYLTKGKIYEVIEEKDAYYLIKEDINNDVSEWWKERFKEVKEPEKSNTIKFRFIPKTEITEVTVDGIEGILIKETS